MQKMIWTPSESAGANSEIPNHAFALQAFFLKFLRLKGAFKRPNRKVFLKKFNRGRFEFGLQGEFSNLLNLKLDTLDHRDAPRHSHKNNTTKNLYFLQFIQPLNLQLNPKLHDPPVWIWIPKTTERHALVIYYAAHERLHTHFSSVCHTSKQAAVCEGAKEEDEALRGIFGLL
jgi:hypothetical protein